MVRYVSDISEMLPEILRRKELYIACYKVFETVTYELLCSENFISLCQKMWGGLSISLWRQLNFLDCQSHKGRWGHITSNLVSSKILHGCSDLLKALTGFYCFGSKLSNDQQSHCVTCQNWQGWLLEILIGETGRGGMWSINYAQVSSQSLEMLVQTF